MESESIKYKSNPENRESDWFLGYLMGSSCIWLLLDLNKYKFNGENIQPNNIKYLINW